MHKLDFWKHQMTTKLLSACFSSQEEKPKIWPITHFTYPESHMIIVINILSCHVFQSKTLF